MRLLAPRIALAAGFVAAALAVYAPALDGPFLSDDVSYVSGNLFVQQPARHLGAILLPGGEASLQVRNYAPVHLLLHALEWQLFGSQVRGYHVVNVLVHVLVALAFVALLRRATWPPWAAALGGLLLLVHPANVEAVAWISQLKTTGALGLALLALLVRPRRPVVASGVFALALLAKPVAVVALGFALTVDLVAPHDGSRLRVAERRRRRAGLLAWAIVFVAFAAIELSAFASDAPAAPVHPDPLVRLRTSIEIGGRYLWMALSSAGLSAFHEPAPVTRWSTPSLLASGVALALLGWRTLHTLRARRLEGAFWIWAIVAFVPVSQIFPFRYPMADRYLYPALPALIAAGGLALRDAARRVPAAARPTLLRLAVVSGLVVALGFAIRSHDRAAVWQSPWRLTADAARNYPDGSMAALLRARSRAGAGDAAGAVAALRFLFERGWNQLEPLLLDPAFGRVRDTPEFQALVHDVAGGWIDFFADRELSQAELVQLARAHRARGEHEAASRALDRADARGGPMDDAVEAERRALRGATGAD